MQVMETQGFAGVIGHEDVIRHFRKALENGKISHAYILSGDSGSGKKMLADLFAMALQCQQGKGEACGECESCKKAGHHAHPDIVYLMHDKPNLISVDEVREQIVSSAALKPYEGKHKIYIIADAEKMNQQAQNALLKTIEEPPSYAVFLLLTRSAEALLPTIVSRCVTLSLKPVPDEKVIDYLMKNNGISQYEAEIAAAFAQGNIGRAKEITADASYMTMTQQMIHLLRRISQVPIVDLVDYVREISAEKQNIQDYLDILAMWFRDVLLYKATKEIDNLIFKKEIKDIREQAVMCSYPGLEDIIQSIEKAGERLRANVTFELTMELLLLSVRENMND